jgi:3'-phosphoadenosine 5'-phosphosulfate sulfotransferase (PAPS reductase)/FAD synthetase
MKRKPASELTDRYRVMKLADLLPADYNPRKITDAALKGLGKSIGKFDLVQPIVWNQRTNRIVGGHQRVKAMLAMGRTEADVRVVDLNEAEEKALNLTLNNPAITGDFTADLWPMIEDLKLSTVDMPDFGFGDLMLDDLFPIAKKASRPKAGQQGGQESVDSNIHAIEDLAPTPEEMEKIKGRKVLVMFSGGVDSSTAALWAKRFLPDPELVFMDHGCDWPGFVFHLHDVSKAIGLPLRVERGPNLIDALLRRGQVFWNHPWCRQEMQPDMAEKVAQEYGGKVCWVRGSRRAERVGAGGASKTGKGKTAAYTERVNQWLKTDSLNFNPLYFVLGKEFGREVLTAAGIPLWPGYAAGLQRTCCRICPGQRRATYAVIRSKFPDVWAEIKELERRIGQTPWQGGDLGMTFDDCADRGDIALAKKELDPDDTDPVIEE